jgi:sugar lactone lactonase YvrE
MRSSPSTPCALTPERRRQANIAAGGPDLKTLYVTAGDKVFKRKTQAEGIRYFKK